MNGFPVRPGFQGKGRDEGWGRARQWFSKSRLDFRKDGMEEM
jgi:hypothetical protein